MTKSLTSLLTRTVFKLQDHCNKCLLCQDHGVSQTKEDVAKNPTPAMEQMQAGGYKLSKFEEAQHNNNQSTI